MYYKSIDVFVIKKNGWFVLLEVEENHRSWETVLVTKLCLFLRVFLFLFFAKERLILPALNQMILDEIRQSNGIKSQKINFFMIFCTFFPHKEIFVLKCLQKLFIPFVWNIKNIPSAHQSSTLYLILSHIQVEAKSKWRPCTDPYSVRSQVRTIITMYIVHFPYGKD